MTAETAPFRANAVLAGGLFLAATGATVISQILLDPILGAPDPAASARAARGLFAAGILLEAVNALASAGIAIALFPILRRVSETAAAGYLSIRAVEAAAGIAAAAGFAAVLLGEDAALAGFALHDAGFLMVLTVFSVSTLILYPTLYRARLVPRWLSAWGGIGGALLLVSFVMILAGRYRMGATPDALLSLPIAVQEMALALWLIFRGVETGAIPPSAGEA